MTKIEQAAAKIRRYRQNPKLFVHEELHADMDAWQEETLDYLATPDYVPRRRIAMKACTGPGKSTVLAWIGWWRLSCFGGKDRHPKGAALSGEGRDNLRDNLWAELGRWQHRSEFLRTAFTWNKEQIVANDHQQDWFLSARSYPKNADVEEIGRALSGLHSPFPFVLLDEIGGMPLQVGQKAEQIFTGSPVDALIAAAGNPTSLSGLLYQVAKLLREQWHLVTITADPDDPKRTPRVDIDHAREQIRLYGRDNPWVKATILGEFPDGDMNALLGVEEVELSMRRQLDGDYIYAQKRLGVDVARFGDDRTILAPRQGLRAFQMVTMRNARSNEIAARVALAKANWAQGDMVREFIDDTGGFGSGVVDSLIQGGHAPTPVNFSSRADDPQRYANRRAEMYFRMAEWVKRGGVLPPDTELIKELTAPTYMFVGGKFQLEPKDKIKERIRVSTDKADALALTFAEVDMPGRIQVIPGVPLQSLISGGPAKSEYDPFNDPRF